ncbi:unnamed protein product [Polarella glacialis]|uniref:beta-N-acetylhexosaminidase n=1 Tax=Polarella glacialis TaxID=89957 RepID=A0A813FMX0_POLGL|nr:unnamed protein product [Polarella glacialis]
MAPCVTEWCWNKPLCRATGMILALLLVTTAGSCDVRQSMSISADGGVVGSVADKVAKTNHLSATVQVVKDEEGLGSLVVLTLSLSPDGVALPTGWRLCFTWLKATVLRVPSGGSVSGSYVELPPEAALDPGGFRAILLAIAPPSMRYASDLPRGLHVVIPEKADGQNNNNNNNLNNKDIVFPVHLVPPGEGQIRFDPTPTGTSGVVPRPMESDQRVGEPGFLINAGLGGPVRVSVRSKVAEPAGQLLRDWLAVWPPGAPFAEFAGDRRASQEQGQDRGPLRQLVLVEAPEESDRAWLGAEGYELSIEDSEIRISAASTDGFHRGVASLRQILGVALTEGKAEVPPLKIRDRPRFSYRGLMLDVARHFFPVSFITRLLDWMYLYKLNVFHWHLTDDEGWRLEVKSLPNLTAYGAWRGRGEAVEPQTAAAQAGTVASTPTRM